MGAGCVLGEGLTHLDVANHHLPTYVFTKKIALDNVLLMRMVNVQID